MIKNVECGLNTILIKKETLLSPCLRLWCLGPIPYNTLGRGSCGESVLSFFSHSVGIQNPSEPVKNSI